MIDRITRRLHRFGTARGANVAILMALRVAAQGNSGAVNALTGILNALPNAGATVPIGQVDPLGDAAALAPQAGLAGASVDVRSVLSATAALANGRTQVSVDLGPRCRAFSPPA